LSIYTFRTVRLFFDMQDEDYEPDVDAVMEAQVPAVTIVRPVTLRAHVRWLLSSYNAPAYSRPGAMAYVLRQWNERSPATRQWEQQKATIAAQANLLAFHVRSLDFAADMTRYTADVMLALVPKRPTQSGAVTQEAGAGGETLPRAYVGFEKEIPDGHYAAIADAIYSKSSQQSDLGQTTLPTYEGRALVPDQFGNGGVAPRHSIFDDKLLDPEVVKEIATRWIDHNGDNSETAWPLMGMDRSFFLVLNKVLHRRDTMSASARLSTITPYVQGNWSFGMVKKVVQENRAYEPVPEVGFLEYPWLHTSWESKALGEEGTKELVWIFNDENRASAATRPWLNATEIVFDFDSIYASHPALEGKYRPSSTLAADADDTYGPELLNNVVRSIKDDYIRVKRVYGADVRRTQRVRSGAPGWYFEDRLHGLDNEIRVAESLARRGIEATRGGTRPMLEDPDHRSRMAKMIRRALAKPISVDHWYTRLRVVRFVTELYTYPGHLSIKLHREVIPPTVQELYLSGRVTLEEVTIANSNGQQYVVLDAPRQLRVLQVMSVGFIEGNEGILIPEDMPNLHTLYWRSANILDMKNPLPQGLRSLSLDKLYCLSRAPRAQPAQVQVLGLPSLLEHLTIGEASFAVAPPRNFFPPNLVSLWISGLGVFANAFNATLRLPDSIRRLAVYINYQDGAWSTFSLPFANIPARLEAFYSNVPPRAFLETNGRRQLKLPASLDALNISFRPEVVPLAEWWTIGDVKRVVPKRPSLRSFRTPLPAVALKGVTDLVAARVATGVSKREAIADLFSPTMTTLDVDVRNRVDTEGGGIVLGFYSKAYTHRRDIAFVSEFVSTLRLWFFQPESEFAPPQLDRRVVDCERIETLHLISAVARPPLVHRFSDTLIGDYMSFAPNLKRIVISASSGFVLTPRMLPHSIEYLEVDDSVIFLGMDSGHWPQNLRVLRLCRERTIHEILGASGDFVFNSPVTPLAPNRGRMQITTFPHNIDRIEVQYTCRYAALVRAQFYQYRQNGSFVRKPSNWQMSQVQITWFE
jgi:hypothetical protein